MTQILVVSHKSTYTLPKSISPLQSESLVADEAI
uniref:Uncharacterized protein n=1 Tax=Arundo donax TaxID=35708 RepID=A0A0A8YS39_ARUDO